ncbi:MAG: LamG-like jellyroll fold domain-containing protein [Planctomycetota bacterium]
MLTPSKFTTARLLAASSTLALAGAAAGQATFVPGYTIGSGLLGTDLIFDNAQNAGLSTFDFRANDTGNGAGAFTWAATWDNLWEVGTDVEITGIALPLRSPNTGTANNTANGTFTFSFYEIGGGDNASDWDGTDNGETLLTTRDVIYSSAGVAPAAQVVYATFDSPITYNAASTGLAISLDSTSSIRTRLDSSPDTADGRISNIINGDQSNGSAVQWTLAGSPIFEPPAPPVLPFRFDAAVDEPGNRAWSSVAPTFEVFNFTNEGTPTPVAVSDPAVPGITAAYEEGAIGTADTFDRTDFTSNVQASRQDATFEVWFKPDSLAGGDQIIYEAGGSGVGSYISLQDDALSLFVNGQIDNVTASTTLTDAEWTQVVGVIHTTFDANFPSQDDYIELYVNGQLAVSTVANLSDINDWAGGNQAGLGVEAGSIAIDGPIDASAQDIAVDEYDFAGQIASLEYFTSALDAATILQRYNDITTAVVVGIVGDYDEDGQVAQGDLNLVLNNWGSARTFEDPGGTVFATANVDQEELNGVLNNWGSQAAPSFEGSAVPEPVSLAVFAGLGLAGLRRRSH